MEIKNSDIKVLGRIAAITVDGIVASAEQVYDEAFKKDQKSINANLTTSYREVSNNLYALSKIVGESCVKYADSITNEEILKLFEP